MARNELKNCIYFLVSILTLFPCNWLDAALPDKTKVTPNPDMDRVLNETLLAFEALEQVNTLNKDTNSCSNEGGRVHLPFDLSKMGQNAYEHTRSTADAMASRLSYQDLLYEGVCGLGDAGRALCEAVKDDNLKDPKTFNPLTHLQRFFELAAANIASRVVGKVYHATTSDPQEETVSLTALISQARNAYQANPSFTQDQKLYFRTLLSEADKELATYVQRKKAETINGIGKDSKPLTMNTLTGMVKSTASVYTPTIADLEKEPKLREIFEKLEKSLQYPTQPKVLDPFQVSADCEKALAMRTPEFREKLLSLASGLASGSKNEQFNRDFHYFYGEAGNGKTTSIELLAKCVGIPICTIRMENIIQDKYYSPDHQNSMTDIAEAGSQGKVAPGNSRVKLGPVDLLTREIASCYSKDFIDPITHEPISNGIVLMDDLDRVLKFIDSRSSGTLVGMGEDSSVTTRLRLFELIKKLGDPAPTSSTLIDPTTGFPIDISRTTFFLTGNSIPLELKRGDPATMSRIRKYSVPYPTPDDRKKFVDFTFEEFKSKILPGLGDIQLDEKDCQQVLGRILKYDTKKYNSTEQRFGIRGLQRLLSDYLNHIKTPIAGSNTVRGCNGFKVEQAAIAITDYSKPVSEALVEEDFENEVRLYHQRNQDDIDAISSKEVKDFVQGKLQFALLDDIPQAASTQTNGYYGSPPPVSTVTRTMKERRAAFEEAKTTLKFAIDRKDFSGTEGKLSAQFRERFSYLEDDQKHYRPLATLANSVALRLSGASVATRPNKVVLVDKQDEFGDTGVIRSLADLFGVPLCEVQDKNQLRKSNPPKWTEFKVKKEKGDNFYDQQIYVDLKYNAAREVYFGNKNSNENERYIFNPKTQRSEPITKDEWESAGSVENAWMDSCLKFWKDQAYPGQGFVLISVPDLTDEEYKTTAELAFDEINNHKSHEAKKEESKQIRDMSQVTVFILPDSNNKNQPLAEGPTKEHFQQLPVGTLSIHARAQIADGMMKDALESLSKRLGKPIDLTPKEKKLFELLKSWDKHMATQVEGKLSLKPLRSMVDVFSNDIEQRNEDLLSLLDQDRKPLDVVRDIERLYRSHLPDAKGHELGKRREKLEFLQEFEDKFRRLFKIKDKVLGQKEGSKADGDLPGKSQEIASQKSTKNSFEERSSQLSKVKLSKAELQDQKGLLTQWKTEEELRFKIDKMSREIKDLTESKTLFANQMSQLRNDIEKIEVEIDSERKSLLEGKRLFLNLKNKYPEENGRIDQLEKYSNENRSKPDYDNEVKEMISNWNEDLRSAYLNEEKIARKVDSTERFKNDEVSELERRNVKNSEMEVKISDLKREREVLKLELKASLEKRTQDSRKISNEY